MRVVMAALLAASLQVALAASPSQPAELSPASNAADRIVEQAEKVIRESEREQGELVAGVSKMCDVELEATMQWIEDGVALREEAQVEDKHALAAALEARAESIGKLLAQLRGLRAQLHGHAQRVNGVFEAMHGAMEAEVKQDTASLEALGVAFGDWGVFKSPAKRPIRLSGEDAIALLEVEVSRTAAGAPEHVDTLDSVFANLKRAVSLWEPMNVDFGREREVLGKLDAEIGGVIEKKAAKLVALKEQAEHLRGNTKAASGDGAKLDSAFDAIRQHRTVMQRACGDARHHARVSRQLKEQISSFISGSGAQATGGSSEDMAGIKPIDLPEPAGAEAEVEEEEGREDSAGPSGEAESEQGAGRASSVSAKMPLEHIESAAGDLLSKVLSSPIAGKRRLR